jgi:hypothetical protein
MTYNFIVNNLSIIVSLTLLLLKLFVLRAVRKLIQYISKGFDVKYKKISHVVLMEVFCSTTTVSIPALTSIL